MYEAVPVNWSKDIGGQPSTPALPVALPRLTAPPAASAAGSLWKPVGEVLDHLRGLVRLDVDGERLLDAELVVEQRDLVLARGQLDLALGRLQPGVAAVDEDLARRLGAERERA